jgi:Allene oxide cyclase barrel like domain
VRLGKLGPGLAALLACAALAGCGTSNAAPAKPAASTSASDVMSSVSHTESSGCISIDLYENTSAYYVGNSSTSLGAIGSYHDVLWSSASLTTKVGTGMGTYVITNRDSASNDLIEYSTEQDQFPDGSFVISDYFDRTKMQAGQWIGGLNGQGMQVTGTSGRYLGMSGKVVWHVISLSAPGAPSELKYQLCGRHRTSG